MWHVATLIHDKGSLEMAEFFETAWADGVTRVETHKYNGEAKRQSPVFHAHEVVTDTSALAVLPKDGKVLTIYGHGNYHHYTYGICKHVAWPRSNDYLYTHIDYHTDDARSRSFTKKSGLIFKELSCGAFTHDIKDYGAKNFLFLGCDVKCGPRTTRTYNQRKLQNAVKKGGLKPLIARILRGKRCDDVYLSMDLDVLRNEDMVTGYQQGDLNLEQLLEIVGTIREEKNIIGADILGYSGSACYNAQDLSTQWRYYIELSQLTYLILASKVAGKDYYEPLRMRNWILKRHYRSHNRYNVHDFKTDIADMLKDFRI